MEEQEEAALSQSCCSSSDCQEGRRATLWPGAMGGRQSCRVARGPWARSGESLTSWEAAL